MVSPYHLAPGTLKNLLRASQIDRERNAKRREMRAHLRRTQQIVMAMIPGPLYVGGVKVEQQ